MLPLAIPLSVTIESGIMNLSNLLKSSQLILTEGSMYDRLKRAAGDLFDPYLIHLGLLFSEPGRETIAKVYLEYIQAAHDFNFPVIILSPTWRANEENIQHSPTKEKNPNALGVDFLIKLRQKIPASSPAVLVGGTFGPKGDCYLPEQAPSTEEALKFHAPQIEKLAATKADFLFGSTLPSFKEAKAQAKLISETNKAYILSFIVNSDGQLLDGTELHQAADEIDQSTNNPPTCYTVNCVHPNIFAQGFRKQLKKMPPLKTRVIGIQGNTSPRPAEQLLDLTNLETESPPVFAQHSLALHQEFNTKIIGGCCGTNTTHIQAIAKLAST